MRILRKIKVDSSGASSSNGSGGSEYFFKENLSGRMTSELEVFNGYCYELLLGNRHSKTRSLHTAAGDRAGVASKKIAGFQSFQNLYTSRQYTTIPQQLLLNSEAIKVWVAAYVEEENDLHGGNYGIDDSGFCVKIDDDQSTWEKMSKYSVSYGVDANEVCPRSKVIPKQSFPVTTDDIRQLPYLTHAHPFNWPDRSDLISKNVCLIEFDKINKNGKFINDKFYMFLKRILIPDSVYAAIAEVTISSEKKRVEFAKHKCHKTQILKNVLLTMPEFREYLQTHPNAIDKILQEFEQYNVSKMKPGKEALHINLEEVKNNMAVINAAAFSMQAELSISVVQDSTDSVIELDEIDSEVKDTWTDLMERVLSNFSKRDGSDSDKYNAMCYLVWEIRTSVFTNNHLNDHVAAFFILAMQKRTNLNFFTAKTLTAEFVINEINKHLKLIGMTQALFTLGGDKIEYVDIANKLTRNVGANMVARRVLRSHYEKNLHYPPKVAQQRAYDTSFTVRKFK